MFLNDEQIKWMDMMKMIISAKPDLETTYVPKNRIRKFVHWIATSQVFDIIIMIFIVLNMF